MITSGAGGGVLRGRDQGLRRLGRSGGHRQHQQLALFVDPNDVLLWVAIDHGAAPRGSLHAQRLGAQAAPVQVPVELVERGRKVKRPGRRPGPKRAQARLREGQHAGGRSGAQLGRIGPVEGRPRDIAQALVDGRAHVAEQDAGGHILGSADLGVEARQQGRRVPAPAQRRRHEDRGEGQYAPGAAIDARVHLVELARRRGRGLWVVGVAQHPRAEHRRGPRPLPETDLFLNVGLEVQPAGPRGVCAIVEGAGLRRRRAYEGEALHGHIVRHAPAVVSGIDWAP